MNGRVPGPISIERGGAERDLAQTPEAQGYPALFASAVVQALLCPEGQSADFRGARL